MSRSSAQHFSISALLLENWKSIIKCQVHFSALLFSPNFGPTSPYCLDSSSMSLNRFFFKVSWPAFCYQQASLLLSEMEISNQVTFEHSGVISWNIIFNITGIENYKEILNLDLKQIDGKTINVIRNQDFSL